VRGWGRVRRAVSQRSVSSGKRGKYQWGGSAAAGGERVKVAGVSETSGRTGLAPLGGKKPPGRLSKIFCRREEWGRNGLQADNSKTKGCRD